MRVRDPESHRRSLRPFYRAEHGLFVSTGILYNHESHLRAEKFVSQRIIQGALRIERGEQTSLALGDLSAEVDWGYAPDFVDAMIRMLALESPDDFIVATGETHSVREFVQIVFGLLGLDWETHVKEDHSLLARRTPPMGRCFALARAHCMETVGDLRADGYSSGRRGTR